MRLKNEEKTFTLINANLKRINTNFTKKNASYNPLSALKERLRGVAWYFHDGESLNSPLSFALSKCIKKEGCPVFPDGGFLPNWECGHLARVQQETAVQLFTMHHCMVRAGSPLSQLVRPTFLTHF